MAPPHTVMKLLAAELARLPVHSPLASQPPSFSLRPGGSCDQSRAACAQLAASATARGCSASSHHRRHAGSRTSAATTPDVERETAPCPSAAHLSGANGTRALPSAQGKSDSHADCTARQPQGNGHHGENEYPPPRSCRSGVFSYQLSVSVTLPPYHSS